MRTPHPHTTHSSPHNSARRDVQSSPRIPSQPSAPHAHPSPSRPRALNEDTRTSNTLTICTDTELPGTGRVPGRPRLARPPAPQDHDPPNGTPTPGLRHPRYAYRVTLRPTQVASDINYPQLVREPRVHQYSSNPMPVQPDPVDPNCQTQTPQPGLQHPKITKRQHRASPEQRAKGLQIRSSLQGHSGLFGIAGHFPDPRSQVDGHCPSPHLPKRPSRPSPT